MGRSAEMWQEQQEREQDQAEFDAEVTAQQDTHYVVLRTEDDLFGLMCAMNQARLEEIERDMEPHKRTGYGERMAEHADMRRKEKRENGE